MQDDYIVRIDISRHSSEQFMVLTVEAALQLGYKIKFISAGTLELLSISTENKIRIDIEEHYAGLSSASDSSGRGKQQLDELVARIELLSMTLTPSDIAQRLEKQKLFFETEAFVMKEEGAEKSRFAGFMTFFKPRAGYFISPILMDINILLFLLMIMSGVNIMLPDTESLISWGANFKPLTLGGEWWRLLTCCFLHIGILHLALNMYALVYIGTMLEPVLGRGRFLSAYLLTGISASLSSLWWHDFTVSAGASGAVFGMYGVFLSLLTTSLIEEGVRKDLLKSIGIFVGYNLLFGLSAGIDNAAHIGGLLSGIVIGYLFVPGLKNHRILNKNISIVLVTVLVLSAAAVVYQRLPNNFAQYDLSMDEFTENEKKAFEIYQLPTGSSKETQLKAIREGMIYWNKNIMMLENLEKIELPEKIVQRNVLLKEYSTLRLRSFELLLLAVEENTDVHDANIQAVNKKIEEVLNRLKNKDEQ